MLRWLLHEATQLLNFTSKTGFPEVFIATHLLKKHIFVKRKKKENKQKKTYIVANAILWKCLVLLYSLNVSRFMFRYLLFDLINLLVKPEIKNAFHSTVPSCIFCFTLWFIRQFILHSGPQQGNFKYVNVVIYSEI